MLKAVELYTLNGDMGGVGISHRKADLRACMGFQRDSAVDRPQDGSHSCGGAAGPERSCELGAEWGFGNSPPHPHPGRQRSPGPGSEKWADVSQVRLRESQTPDGRPQTTLWGGLWRGNVTWSWPWPPRLVGPCLPCKCLVGPRLAPLGAPQSSREQLEGPALQRWGAALPAEALAPVEAADTQQWQVRL